VAVAATLKVAGTKKEVQMVVDLLIQAELPLLGENDGADSGACRLLFCCLM